MKFIASAANIINQAEYAFLLLTHPQQSSDYLQRFVQSGLADGYILMQVHLQDSRVELLRREGLPFVLIGRCADNSGLAYVDVDIDTAITDCVEYLTGLGHHSIAYLYQDAPGFGYTIRAQRAFTKACQRHHIEPRLQSCELSMDSGVAATNALLDRHPDTTAIIVWNDLASWGVVQAAQTRDLHVPQDLSFITFDFSTISQMTPFKPTAVDIHPGQSAGLAVQMLLKLLAGESPTPSQILIKHTLASGESVGPPAKTRSKL